MKLLFLGDFYFDYDIIPDDLLEISKYIKKNKLVTILNLEGSLKSSTPCNKPAVLSFSDKYIDVLKLLNVRAVNLANNHIMDYGFDGLRKIINQLDKENIGYFGAGVNIEKASIPFIINDKKHLIALTGMGWNMEECINATKKNPGTCPVDFNILNNIVNETKADIFIPILHMGYEYENLPQPYHLKECRKLLNNKKIKLIIGHHPHVVQAFEKNIFYSLGNFYFGSRRDNFDKKNERDDCNKGIGVIYDTDKNTYEVIKFQYNGKESKINNNVEIKNLEDITSISTEEYSDFFKQNNRFKNKKFVYKIGKINEVIFNKFNYPRRTVYKFYLRKIKWPLGKIVKKIVRS